MTDVRTISHLTDTLADIGRWYPATEDPPRAAVSQIRTAPGSKPPIPADVLSLRRDTIDALTSWALLVAEERDLHPTTPCPRLDTLPVTLGPACQDCEHASCSRTTPQTVCGCGRGGGTEHPLDNRDAPALVAFLSAHAEWLAGHEAGADAIVELGRLAAMLEQVAKQSRPARVRVGACPEVDCIGELVALVRQRDSLLPSTVRCDVDRDHAWEPHDWLALGRRLHGEDAPMPWGVSA